MKRIVGSVLVAVIGLYFFVSIFLFAPYFNWVYARDHGLWQWVAFGEVVATAKGFTWPLFVFDRGKPVTAAARHHDNSKKACDEALRIVVRSGDVARMSAADSSEVVKLLRLSISEARQVDGEYLAAIHPEFPRRYSEEYVGGLQLLAEGLESGEKARALAGSYGYNEFATWMEQNKRSLKFD